ncbi:MAG: glycosyl hydrolase [Firmicutes bacterium]|nr:glycosyl hydrolase [Bacillota bacterium]
MALSDPLSQVASMRWRNIGPFRGGRSVAVAGHPRDRLTFYAGTTGGGLWRTTNGGITWHNITDGFVRSASVGAVAVSASDPNVIYLGMGEACIRGNVSFGDGVYRSTDGGATWRHLGLADTRHIARIRVHPEDPDLVYVAALGHAFGPNRERGVYRSRDGGQTWQAVLQVSDRTGAIDLAFDPFNPRVLFAAMYTARRQPWSFESGGPESGLYRSTDGGDTWERIGIGRGLPEGVLGRIGVAPSGARRGRVWAMVEAAQGGLYRSDDGGDTWELMTDARGPRSRPWYYSHMFAHPTEPDTCYVLSAGYYRSTDGGRTVERVRTPHGDHHDLWIDPADPRRQIHGADGGPSITFDGGESWSSVHAMPTAELYHVTTDDRFPYRVYGAQQDNTTISVPSASHYPALTKREWYEVGGAESGYIAIRPDNPDIVYAGSSGFGEGGRLTRYDHATKQLRDISPWPEKTCGVAAEAYTYRFQWTSPIAVGIHDPKALYFCGNRIFRTRDEGQTWEIMSPDLTRNDPEKLRPSGGPITLDHTGVEVYCTVFAFAESPLRAGMFWAGSDDGLVHLTLDDGATWQDVTPPSLPEWSLVSIIEPSRHDADTAYLAANRYKLDDTRPLLFRTRDGGRTWTEITRGLPEDEYARVVREDPEVPGLLYCGTERGVWVSFDAGDLWRPLRLNLPVVPVHDLAVKGTDLVAATHGRSFWILDDIGPLRQLARDPEVRAVRLFRPRDTVRTTASSEVWDRLPDKVTHPVILADHYVAAVPETGDAPVYADAGQNRPPGVILQYYLEREAEGPVTITVRDAEGREAVRWSSEPGRPGDPKPIPKSAGSHRRVWDMRYPGAAPVPGSAYEWPRCAPLAPPGEYEVELAVGGRSERHRFRLLPPPDVATAEEEYREQFRLLERVRDRVDAIHRAFGTAGELIAQIDNCLARAAGDAREGELRALAEPLRAALEGVRDELVQWRVGDVQDELNFPPRLNAQVAHIFQVAASADARPTSQTYLALEVLERRCDEVLGRLRALVEGDVERFNARVLELRLPALKA